MQDTLYSARGRSHTFLSLWLFMFGISVISGCSSSRNVISHAGPQDQKELKQRIDTVLSDSSFKNANWAVLIKNLDSGEVLYKKNAGKSLIPASNGKIYTTAAALDQLGTDFTYKTHLYTNGIRRDSLLDGDLIVRGSGDPVIGGQLDDGDQTALFRAWADSLKALGIYRISGNVIGDDNLFDDLPLGMAWSWDDESFWYSAEIGALSFNDNTIDFTITGNEPGLPATITWEPAQTSYASVFNSTITAEADSSRSITYHRDRGSNRYQVSGKIPTNTEYNISMSVFNSTQYFVEVLKETLHDQGITVEGVPVDSDVLPDSIDYAAADLRLVATHTSPPLKAIVKRLNKRSHNLYAELLLKTLGAVKPVTGTEIKSGSAEMGLARAMDTFAAAGADTSRMHLRDGSGLSRMSYVTAEMTASVLSYMWHHPDDSTRAAFLASLPVGGIDGTLETRFQSPPVYGRVRAKTGTMTGVSALSGFVPAANGTPLVFVLMCNQYTVPTFEVRRAQDAIVELLATYDR